MTTVLSTVNEGTTCYVTANFKDKNDADAVPTSVDYEIHDKETGTEILASTSVTPAATVEVTITSDQNQIVTETETFEIHLVTFTATYGAGDKATEQFEFAVKNLHAV